MSKDRFSGVDVKDVVEDSNPSPLMRKMEKDNQELRRRLEETKLEMGEHEAVFESIKREFKGIEMKDPVVHIPTSKVTKVSAPLSAVMVLSDWHIGEYVEADEIEGFNQFSWTIAQKRAYYLQKQFVNWVAVQRTAMVVDELVVVCVGDLISGDIHQELQVTNEFPVPVQTVRAGVLVAKTIAEMAPHFQKVRVEYVAADNHSRLTKKPQWKEGGFNSYSYIVGWIAKERLAKATNIEFNLHATVKTLVEIQHSKYLCMHGHNIKGWSGIPWYGADRQVARESKARRNRPSKAFNKCILGHFHTPLWTPDYIVNGSLSGTSELDHAFGRESAPSQIAFLVHPKYGEMNKIEFNVANGDDEDFGGAEKALVEKHGYKESSLTE
jgi:hypothetical protein